MGFGSTEITLSSPAWEYHQKIPPKFTGEGEDISPALNWSHVPEGTKSFAIICHDPDAPQIKSGSYGFVHWLLYNLPGSLSGLSEGTKEGTAGANDFGKNGYGGPMPPEGHGTHHYYFMIVALDKMLNLEAGLTIQQLLEKIEPHLVGINRLVGTYKRG